MIDIVDLSDLDNLAGRVLLERERLIVTPDMLARFLDFCGDTNHLHRTENEGLRIIPANLLLSLLPGLIQSKLHISVACRCMTVGYRRVRFSRAFTLQDAIAATIEFRVVRHVRDGKYVEYGFEIFHGAAVKASVDGIMMDYYTVDA